VACVADEQYCGVPVRGWTRRTVNLLALCAGTDSSLDAGGSAGRSGSVHVFIWDLGCRCYLLPYALPLFTISVATCARIVAKLCTGIHDGGSSCTRPRICYDFRRDVLWQRWRMTVALGLARRLRFAVCIPLSVCLPLRPTVCTRTVRTRRCGLCSRSSCIFAALYPASRPACAWDGAF